MGNKLVIVESPAKARTISRILGNNYNLLASMGHVRDLPKNSFGVEINNKFSPKYIISNTKALNSLKKASENADEIYLATDPDREGEAIAWHLKETLSQKTDAEFNRVEFHEITKNAIKNAFNAPRDIDKNLVDSQQARRILDRLVGYQVSPLLWSRIKRNISAGRVQSVALRMICEREQEILSFIPKEYWNFTADFLWKNDNTKKYSSRLFHINGKKTEINNKDEAEKIHHSLENSNLCSIKNIKKEIVRKKSPAPFITSTLQQTAGTTLRFNAGKTMQIAQQLYEGTEQSSGLITYMRTDSFTLSKEAVNKCRNFIAESIGNDFVPKKPNFFKNKSNAQEAHEAIRPTNVYNTPESVKDYLSNDQYNLYRLIWERFVACQMAPAKVSRTTVDTLLTGTDNTEYTFRTVSSVTVFPGYEKLLNTKKDKNESGPEFLTEIQNGDPASPDKISKEQKFTEPPPRYTEPSLIKELEANGIGRPSTYATIISTIQKRKYTVKEKGKLKPTELGFNVNNFLIEHLDSLFNVSFTAKMEKKLDKIEEGNENWTDMLQEFYNRFIKWLDSAKYKEAPEEEKVKALLEKLDKIKRWDPPSKASSSTRAKNDKTFLTSLKKQFDKNGKLSKKQWESLLMLSVKYIDQIPELPEISEKFNFTEDFHRIKKQFEEKKKLNEKKAEENKEITEKMTKAINSLKDEEIKNFLFNNSYRFKEEDFFNSLKVRTKQNLPFTDKQEKVFCRILFNNKDKISNFDEIKNILQINEEDYGSNGKTSPEEKSRNEEIEQLLSNFENFSGWAKPEKKGKRTYDDKTFYDSLLKQYQSKKKLSPKQLYALKKLASKYFGN
ncbi:MAG: type I DNA topoisomerase [Victivallales bacterium]|nr:type I DNA topoisomerase [Victivallales bacterium]